MDTKDDITLVSPCGGYCGDCPAYKVKAEPSWGEVLTKKFNWRGVPCEGCRPLKGKCQFVEGTCETYACISKRGHDFCFECADFPCAKLNPAADKAADLPHNIKLFALCYIRQHGVDKWKEKTSEVKKRYFMGKMAVGKGPQVE